MVIVISRTLDLAQDGFAFLLMLLLLICVNFWRFNQGLVLMSLPTVHFFHLFWTVQW